MSNHPTRAVQTKRVYTPPTVTQLNPTHDPSSTQSEKLRSNLKQLDAVLTLNPNDSTAAELRKALHGTLAEQESRQPITA